MRSNLPMEAEQYTTKNRLRRIWRKIVRVMACIVVFCTTYALILPAITQESDTQCGLGEHTHTDACYSCGAVRQLACTAESLGIHSHTDGCRNGEGDLICGQADYTAHSHDASCVDAAGALVCTLPELAQHVHTDGCYALVPARTAHTHTDECRSSVRGPLACTLEEAAGHAHAEGCYSTVLGCVLPENHTHSGACWHSTPACTLGEGEDHIHSAQCRGVKMTLVCTVPEGHVHGGACYEQQLVCTLAESAGHSHGDSCYTWEQAVTCGLEELAEEVPAFRELICTEPLAPVHVHGEGCFTESDTGETVLGCGQEAHTHMLMCYSDPTADLESQAVWDRSVSAAELTGEWGPDVVAIARTQLGYVESTRNYRVLSDGTSVRGYSRYGDWYGDPYGDWCAMFASFCLDYAGVDMPLHSNVDGWIEALSAEEWSLYHPQGNHVPEAGELIFFDWDGDGSSNHVGIVAEVTVGENGTIPQITTIEGNSANRVRTKTYSMDNATILGYGALPVQLTSGEQSPVEEVIALIDALPTADEIDAKLAEYEASGDTEGEEAYYTEVSQQVASAYHYYSNLSDEEKEQVTNADKLMELEYIWSVTEYISDISSDAPTVGPYTSTKDFVELNLYDYNGNVNTNYWSKNDWYPGFQWNGGAYAKSEYIDEDADADEGVPNSTVDRNRIDSIDFGNSIITNYSYGYGQGYVSYAKAVNATDVTRTSAKYGESGPLNWIYGNSTEGYTNKPIGFSTTDQTQSHAVMKYTLVGGYPALYDGTMLDYLFKEGEAVDKLNTESIDGLFLQNDTTGAYSYNSRTNHAQYANNFFTRYEEIITPNFITYPFGNFLPLNSISDLTQATQVGKFNYDGGVKDYFEAIIDDLEAAPEDWQTSSRTQLITMMREYQENWTLYPNMSDGNGGTKYVGWSNLSAANAIRDYFFGDTNGDGDKPSPNDGFITQTHLNNMYNIDFDVATNFFFGMEMKMEVMMPKNGLTGYDNGNNTTGTWAVNASGDYYRTGEPDGTPDYPMVFNFTGDDDVWVYIDGVLFLDLSGIHRHVGGRIDFSSGKVYYFALNPSTTGDVGENSSDAYATYTFEEILIAAGADTSVLNDKGTFKDYSTHTFNFYYMERGSGSSVCRLNFNFPLLKQNSISVTKENVTVKKDDDGNYDVVTDSTVLGNPDYYFNIVNSSNQLFVGPGSVTGITTYKIKDSDGNILKNVDGTDQTFETDQYGIFTLKAGQTAIFEGIEENEGKYFVQELIKEEDNGQYPEVFINDTISRYNDLIDWSYRKYFYPDERTEVIHVGPYGYKWYGRSGQDTDSSSGSSFYFEQQNWVDVERLGKLSVTKMLEGTDTSRTFDMEVTLDGLKLPVGTKYTVGTTEKTVQTEGIVTITPGETATISNILSGTKFEVREVNGEGYTVTYSYDGALESDADEFTSDGTSVSGVVRTGGTVTVTVTNAEQGTEVEIPVTKSFTNGVDGLAHEYTFTLTQVTDATGTSDVPDDTVLTLPMEFTGNNASDAFKLTYLRHQLETLPATFYYRITENGEESDSRDNTQSFIAAVRVEEDASGALTASLVSINGSSDTKSADFVNTLVGSLSLEKIVKGSSESVSKEFSFSIALSPGESGVDPLPSSYTAEFHQQDGTIDHVDLPLTDGVINLSGFKHGETAVIYGIPVGTTWTITETTTNGFTVTTGVTTHDGTTSGTGAVTSGSIVTGETEVAYTNTQTYVLPETGGTGPAAYTMAGWMLMLSSTAYLLYRHRKRRRGGV